MSLEGMKRKTNTRAYIEEMNALAGREEPQFELRP
jgi:hypothetical protein